MNAYVDDAGRALVTVLIRQSDVSESREIMAWIDTGFTGDLVLPQRLIDELGLSQSGTVLVVLADGSQITLTRYTCLIEWFGDSRIWKSLRMMASTRCSASACYSGTICMSVTGTGRSSSIKVQSLNDRF